MEKIIIIIETKSKKEIVKLPFINNTITIGRGYDNDLIIEDNYISKNHLRLTQGEKLILEDLDTTNGLIKNSKKKKQKVHHSKIESGSSFTIGKTKISFYFPNHPLPNTKLLTENEQFWPRYKTQILAFTTLILTILWQAIIAQKLTDFEERSFYSSLSISAAMFIGFSLCWSGIWSFIGWLIKKEFNFFKHFKTFNSALLLILITVWFYGIISFNFPIQFVGDYLIPIFIASFFVGILFYSLKHTTQISSKKNILSCSTIGLLLFMIIFLGTYAKSNEYNSNIYFNDFIKSPSFNLRNGKNMEIIKLKHEKLFDEIKLEQDNDK